MQKNALSVQSMACYGKCSLTEALPIISACGISLSALPTALLSTHTGGFGTPEVLDTTEFLQGAIRHLKKESIRFDGIYIGYFGNTKQIEVIIEEIDNLKKDDALILVDPVLGDKGRLFSGITDDYKEKMLKLCQKADIITPNITEAFLLCGDDYTENPDTDVLLALAVKLYNITKARVIITGICCLGKTGCIIFDGECYSTVYTKKYPAYFHGTGDMLAAAVFGLLLNGLSLEKAVKKAVWFIGKAINETVKNKTNERDGIAFEKYIGRLLK